MNKFEHLSDKEIAEKVEEYRRWTENLRNAFGAQLFVGCIFLVITVMHASSDAREFMDVIYWGTLSAMMIGTAALSRMVRSGLFYCLNTLVVCRVIVKKTHNVKQLTNCLTGVENTAAFPTSS